MFNTIKLVTVLSLGISVSTFAGSLTLSSHDIAQGEFMAKAQEFNGFGCDGGDLSPHLKWSNAPKGTKSLLLPLMTQMLQQAVVGGIGRL